ncbi:MAG: S66 peptidase family protein [Candidatus Absconditabacteria bacterium]
MIIPSKLKQGDEIRVIAPARSLSLLKEINIEYAIQKLNSLGFKVSFGKNIREMDSFMSSPIESRIQDLHEAFADKNVKGIFSVIGGFNSNQLLKYIDYELIKNNPKIICGYSDITALCNAITAKTAMITYSGLHFSSWGMLKHFDYNLEYFQKCLMQETPFIVNPSKDWSDDGRYKDQENRNIMENEGYWVINEGVCEGTIYGGNLCTFNLLQGTEFMPNIENSILFLEDDNLVGDSTGLEIDRNLQSIIHLPNFDGVKGIVFGRFQSTSNITQEKMKLIIKSKKELNNIPVLGNVDFGHTNPMITFPIGGTGKIIANQKETKIEIISH